MNKQSFSYIHQMRQTENKQLNKLHGIIKEAVDEESLITQKLAASDTNETFSYGQRLADKVAKFGGSWTFIISFFLILLAWILLNSFVLAKKAFDPYLYILLNLILSCTAALQAPVIMMSQNRKEAKDRKRSENDYMINLKSEIEIRNLHQKMDLIIIDQYKHLCDIQQKQLQILDDIHQRLIRLEK